MDPVEYVENDIKKNHGTYDKDTVTWDTDSHVAAQGGRLGMCPVVSPRPTSKREALL
jgi:hypothetical protein